MLNRSAEPPVAVFESAVLFSSASDPGAVLEPASVVVNSADDQCRVSIARGVAIKGLSPPKAVVKLDSFVRWRHNLRMKAQSRRV